MLEPKIVPDSLKDIKLDLKQIPNSEEKLQLNTIMDVDRYANNDGVVTKQDFINVGVAYKEYQGKLEELYIEFCKQNPNATEDYKTFTVTNVTIPFTTKDTKETIKLIYDKATGNKTLETRRTITTKDGLTTVNVYKECPGINNTKVIESSFQYNIEELENYIINVAVDNYGNKIKKFSSIPKIKQLPETERTEEQKKLLEEFDNLINFTIEIGTEYGVDPKLITSIIQQEVCFDGLSSRVVGINGKGYMQLTSAPIQDYLGYVGEGKYGATKVSIYGPEMAELIASRGFNIQEAKDSASKHQLYKDIINYLTENKDPEFNIRLGTLVLANYLNRADGDVKMAAKNYNGNTSIGSQGIPVRENYANNVGRYDDALRKTVEQDSTYICTVVPRK